MEILECQLRDNNDRCKEESVAGYKFLASYSKGWAREMREERRKSIDCKDVAKVDYSCSSPLDFD
jgi:hypothetical protein